MAIRIDNNVLIHGDSIAVMQRFPDDYFDCLLTDPPYLTLTAAAAGGRRQKNKLGTRMKDAATRTVGDLNFVELAYRGWFDEALRVVKPCGRLFIFCDATTHATVMRSGYGRFPYTSCITWDKGRIGMGGEFRRQTEFIYYARRKDATIADIHGQPDILYFAPVPANAARLHPAQKPVELLVSLFRYVPEGGIVFDPYMGSGSTLEACARTGHKGVGIEIEKEFFDKAVGWLKALK
jgi:DNA modification methylase